MSSLFCVNFYFFCFDVFKMAKIKVKALTKRNPLAPDSARKFYLSAIHGVLVGVEQLANEVSKRCSLLNSNVQGVLLALMKIIHDEICKGNDVWLDKLDTLFVNMSCSGVEGAEEISVSNLKGYKLVHLPTKKCEQLLQMINLSIQTIP